MLIIVPIVLVACGQKASTWQEQYDLGVRYLSEGNYDEAIIAFTAAIEIDPKRAPAYVGRGDAYIGSGETEENLAAAQTDYEQAIELDETNAKAYLGLAEVYMRRGEYNKAREILENALGKAENSQAIINKIVEVETSTDRFYRYGRYIAFESLPEDIRSYIDSLIQAMQKNDTAAVHDILKNHTPNIGGASMENGYMEELRTEVSGYKVEIRKSDTPSVSVEIRPHTGTAVYARYDGPEWGGGDRVESDTYTTGECNGWNWNGKYESHNHTYGTLRTGAGREYEFEQEDWESGTSKDCLKDGIVSEKSIYGTDGKMETETDQRQYEYGVLPDVEGYFRVDEPNHSSGYITSMTFIENVWWWN